MNVVSIPRVLRDLGLQPLVGSVHQLPSARQPDDGGVRERPRGGREGTPTAADAHEIRQLVFSPDPPLHQHQGSQAFPHPGAHRGGG